MLLDVLSGLDGIDDLPSPTNWTASASTHFPGDAFLLERCKPVYETLPGWRGRLPGRAS